MRAEKIVGVVVVLALLMVLTALTAGTDDGSAAARWCAQHDAIVTMTAATRNDTWGQTCLDLYKEAR